MEIGICELCGRENMLNEHHLIPKKNHSKKWFKRTFSREDMKNRKIMVCKEDCHPAIHKFIDEKELGRNYNILESLLNHPEIIKYINWVKNKPVKIRNYV